jgi:hypothetical protein
LGLFVNEKKMRTPEEIKRQVEGLVKMKEWIPEYSKLGDPNHKAIDLQIDILKGVRDWSEFKSIDESDIDNYLENDCLQDAAYRTQYWVTELDDHDLYVDGY